MSKASEWAKRDKAEREKLEAARERIEKELGREGKDKPGPFLLNTNVVGEVTQYDGAPYLLIRANGASPSLNGQRAVQFARWILDTFGEGPDAAQAERESPAERQA